MRKFTKAEAAEFYRRLAETPADPAHRARIHQPVHPAGRGRAVGAGDRCRRQQGDPGAVRARRHAGEDGGARRGAGRAGLIRTIGLYRTKAKNVIALSRLLVEKHGGEVPRDRETLETLPGVGRKTANVVLNVAFEEPTIAVDTHIFRVGNRTGIAPGKTPHAVELGLEARHPAAIQAERASLADPARSPRVQGAQARLPELRRRDPMPLQGEDRRRRN